MTVDFDTKSRVWQPEGRFSIEIDTHTEVKSFNDRGLLPIQLNSLPSKAPSIRIIGSQSKTLSLYSFESIGSCVKEPKPNADLVSINFITNGNIDFRCIDGSATGNKNIAIMASFSHLIDFTSSYYYSSIGGAFSTQTLIEINASLTGEHDNFLPAFSMSAEISTPGLQALFCTMKSVYKQSQLGDLQGDHTFSLIQEIVGYQLLSSWPKKSKIANEIAKFSRPNRLNLAIEYIEENISSTLMLSDIAASAGISVRALQDNFRRSLDQTPFEYIIAKRLMYVHQDLINKNKSGFSISEIASRWGFIHASDFGRRYRLMYGCTPTQTRQYASS